MTQRIMNKRPKYKEDKWVDYDEETTCWGVFGLTSGFCYSLHSSESDANKELDKTKLAYDK
jgi:hypothetical protein